MSSSAVPKEITTDGVELERSYSKGDAAATTRPHHRKPDPRAVAAAHDADHPPQLPHPRPSPSPPTPAPSAEAAPARASPPSPAGAMEVAGEEGSRPHGLLPERTPSSF